jgi:hypothetical protein
MEVWVGTGKTLMLVAEILAVTAVAVQFLLPDEVGITLHSGYLLAKPHNGADKLFAPLMCLIAVYSLWRGRTPTDPSLEP